MALSFRKNIKSAVSSIDFPASSKRTKLIINAPSSAIEIDLSYWQTDRAEMFLKIGSVLTEKLSKFFGIK
jgi:hypothetical protein